MPQLHQAEAQIAIAWPVSCALARTICGVCSVVRVHRHGRRCGRFWLIASTARPCSSPAREATRSPATARSVGCWRPARGPLHERAGRPKRSSDNLGWLSRGSDLERRSVSVTLNASPVRLFRASTPVTERHAARNRSRVPLPCSYNHEHVIRWPLTTEQRCSREGENLYVRPGPRSGARAAARPRCAARRRSGRGPRDAAAGARAGAAAGGIRSTKQHRANGVVRI